VIVSTPFLFAVKATTSDEDAIGSVTKTTRELVCLHRLRRFTNQSLLLQF